MKGCKALSDAEISDIKAILKSTRDYCLFIVGLKSGYRIKELLSLKVKDVIQYDKIVSHITVSRKNMKGSISSRTVKMHSDAAQAILNVINEYQLTPEMYLFQSRKGENNPISRIQAYRILKSAYKACSIQGKTGTHSMRKSFAKRVYEASGKDLLVTQRAMNHVSLSSTQSYLDVNGDLVDEIVSKLK